VVSTIDTTEQLDQLGVADLPGEVQLTLADIASVAREGLLAMSVATGMAVMQTMFDAEVAAVCGLKGRHDVDRTATRHGREKGSVMLGGRRVPITRPRARTTDGHEVPLLTYRLFAAEDQLSAVVMERMPAGLTTRRHTAAAEPVGHDVEEAASATSRSAVSDLVSRGLDAGDGLLVVIDGAKALSAAVTAKCSAGLRPSPTRRVARLRW
jgi:transposase-like protein